MGQVLEGFQDQVTRLTMEQLPRRRLDGKLKYTSSEAARVEAVFESMETYIWRIHNVVTQYITMRSLMDLQEVTERKQGEWVGMWWWD